jgi:hypothetical protein
MFEQPERDIIDLALGRLASDYNDIDAVAIEGLRAKLRSPLAQEAPSIMQEAVDLLRNALTFALHDYSHLLSVAEGARMLNTFAVSERREQIAAWRKEFDL